jgi:GH15 family glucan-1,4-alpha-glucosidase
MTRYPNISDHGLIGDLQTAALVATDATVDWFCCPRFDSPSIFASLLDADKGGHFRIAPDRDDFVSRQLYLPETAVLNTRFMTLDGVGQVHEFMPVITGKATDRHRLVRMLRVPRGTMRFVMDLEPRFDYGRQKHALTISDRGAMFEADGMRLTLHTVGQRRTGDADDHEVQLSRRGDGLHATWTLREGETTGVALESMGGQPRRLSPSELIGLFDDTSRFWRDWLSRSTYTGRWRDMVSRSAMTLKLMTYAPTGAPVAAPTAGLPEQIGGERNWDYRYTWIRDASFSIYVLLGLGYTEEATAFGA